MLWLDPCSWPVPLPMPSQTPLLPAEREPAALHARKASGPRGPAQRPYFATSLPLSLAASHLLPDALLVWQLPPAPPGRWLNPSLSQAPWTDRDPHRGERVLLHSLLLPWPQPRGCSVTRLCPPRLRSPSRGLNPPR